MNLYMVNELDLYCFYCKCEKPTILKPIPIVKESFFKRMSYQWVCNECNKIYDSHLGVIE
jgi:hypothetical protein